MMIVLLGIAILISGCGPAMSQKEKIVFGAMVAGQLCDYESSRKCINSGGTEANAILGRRPDNDSMAIFKLGCVATLWALGEIWPENRIAFYTVGAGSGFASYAWNDYLYERR